MTAKPQPISSSRSRSRTEIRRGRYVEECNSDIAENLEKDIDEILEIYEQALVDALRIAPRNIDTSAIPVSQVHTPRSDCKMIGCLHGRAVEGC